MQAKEQIQTSTEVKPLGELLEYQDSTLFAFASSGGPCCEFLASRR